MLPLLRAAVLRRQTTAKREGQAAWYDDMRGAVRATTIISEILDTRTRHLIQVRTCQELFQQGKPLTMPSWRLHRTTIYQQRDPGHAHAPPHPGAAPASSCITLYE
jgi:hypothetical protein